MRIEQQVTLAPYTTFHIGGPARFFCVVRHLEQLQEALQYAKEHNLRIFILGGGSNILVNDEGFDGLVIKMEIKGIEIVSESESAVRLKVAAGENWDEFVEFVISKGWWGIENLSHIPGSCGAFAVQNVGAYGQEASQVVEAVEAWDTNQNQLTSIPNIECGFSYRSSIFNGREKGRYVILNTIIKLNKLAQPNLSYKDLAERFNGKQPSLTEIREAVIEIRNKKFPYPSGAKNGSAGSFFKNVVLTLEHYHAVKAHICRNFGEDGADKLEQKKIENGGQIKIPTAFLLDICGLKSVSNGHAEINGRQPLVIINRTGEAKAADVLDLAELVLKTVKDKTGLVLSREPELVGFAPKT